MGDSDLMFGEMPDDDSPRGGDEENEFDMNNDETFGAEIKANQDDELEDYAAQTACLRLDDGWDMRGFKESAPDASQLPMPDFDFSAITSSPLTSFLDEDSFAKIDSIWKNEASDLGSVWGDHSKINNLSLDDNSSPSWSFTQTSTSASTLPSIPPMPKGPTVEEMERAHISVPQIPKIPASALSAEDLERSLIQPPTNQAQPTNVHNLPSPNSYEKKPQRVGGDVPMMPPPGMFLPPFPPMLIPYVPLWVDVIIGRIPYLPPNVPPVPPIMVHLMKQFKDPGIVLSMIQRSILPMGPPPPMPGMQNNQNNYNNYHRKPPGMPSGRTIEDLAFDQFAGFMSCKERQWLVKIQLLQCQGVGNPYEDDYYYICWLYKTKNKEKHMALQNSIKNGKDAKKTEENVKGSNRKQRERNGSISQSEAKEPVPLSVKYAGSLGQASRPTTSNPRQLINVHVDPTEEDHEKPQLGAQKKLRSILLQLEAATSLAIECSDRLVAMQSSPQLREQLTAEIESKKQLIFRELLISELGKVLHINKGRSLITRVLKMATNNDKMLLLKLFLSFRSTFSDKLKAQICDEILPSFYRSFANMNRDQMVQLISSFDAQVVKEVIYNAIPICFEILLVVLLACANKKAVSSCGLLVVLRANMETSAAPSTWEPCISRWAYSFSSFKEELTILPQWLTFLAVDGHSSTVASNLSTALVKGLSHL